MGMLHEDLGIGGGLECSWCDCDLNWLNHVSESVCTRCHGLLSNAGVNAADIFAGPEGSEDHVGQRI